MDRHRSGCPLVFYGHPLKGVSFLLSEEQKQKISDEEEYREFIRYKLNKNSPQVSTKGSKNPAISAILSFLIPGLGQIYNEQVGKGISIFIGFIIGLALFVVPGVILYIWQIFDAYNTAKKAE